MAIARPQHIKLTPPPGHKEALEMGCLCSSEDNNYGEGAYILNGMPQYFLNDECRVHCGVPKHETNS